VSHQSCSPLRIAAFSAIVLVALLVPASGAFASTLTSDGSTVTFNADTGEGAQTLDLDDTAGDLTITTTDDPVEYDDTDPGGGVIDTSGEDCVDADGAPTVSPASVVDCDDVDRIVANTNTGDDTIDASGLDVVQATVNGGIDDDTIDGGPASGGDTLNGDAGADDIDGGAGADDIDGGSGNDFALDGGAGSDDISGGSGDDDLFGGDGDDVLRGGDDDDDLEPGDGSDDSDGEAGNDFVLEEDDGGDDRARGGAGVDSLDYDSCDSGCTGGDDVNINENGAEDDGDSEDDPDNDFDGFENVNVEDTNAGATATVLTTAGSDSITGGDHVDVFTPRAGVDSLTMGDGDDTANTVDGYPDIVDCGPGDDTANADQFDELIACEDQNITQVPSAFDDPDDPDPDPDPDDAPPFVAFTNLEPNAFLAPVRTHLEATASDDIGVVLVVFFDGNEVICEDDTAPYTCDWTPTSDDVGNNTLSVWAVDTAGQFGADIQNATVGRFSPDDLNTRVTDRDVKGPRKTRVRGELDLPSGVSSEDGCEGEVRVRIFDGKDKIRQRLVPIREDCSYSRRFRLPKPRTLDHENVKIYTKFLGNDVLGKEKGPRRKTEVH